MSNVPFAPTPSPTTAHLYLTTHARTAQHHAPLPMPQRTFTLTPPNLRPLSLAHTTPHLRTFALLSAEGAERLYDDHGAELPYDQIVASKMSERLYGGIGEKPIGYPRKVYRVFTESL